MDSDAAPEARDSTPREEADAKVASESDLTPPKVRALVLSGGGAKGAYEAGLAITLMHECGEDFDIFCGTSIGAINASFLAQGKLNELGMVWNSIADAGIVVFDERVGAAQRVFASLVDFFKSRWLRAVNAFFRAVVTAIVNFRKINPLETLLTMTGAFNPRGAQNMLAAHLELDDVKRVLLVSVTNVTNEMQQVFYCFPEAFSSAQAHFIHEEPTSLPFDKASFAETIRASGAIPAAFSPVTLPYPSAGAAYVDGGVTNNTPIGQAIDAGANEVTIVYVDPKEAPPKTTPSSIPAILASCFSMMQQCILDLDFKTAIRVNDAVGAKAVDTKKKSIVRIRTFRPDEPLAVGIIDFDKQDAVLRAFQTGQADARNLAKRSLFED